MTDTLIERLRAQYRWIDIWLDRVAESGGVAPAKWQIAQADLARESAVALERAERVVAAARALVDDELSETGDCMVSCHAQREDGAHDSTCSLANARNALEMYDQTRADTTRADPQKSRTTLRREAVQRGEEVPTFDASDQHKAFQKTEEEPT